jgi:DNA-binding PadR family transcriptional regulator
VPERRVRRAYSITERQAEWLREQAHQHRANESGLVRLALDRLMDDTVTDSLDLDELLREEGQT